MEENVFILTPKNHILQTGKRLSVEMPVSNIEEAMAWALDEIGWELNAGAVSPLYRCSCFRECEMKKCEHKEPHEVMASCSEGCYVHEGAECSGCA